MVFRRVDWKPQMGKVKAAVQGSISRGPTCAAHAPTARAGRRHHYRFNFFSKKQHINKFHNPKYERKMNPHTQTHTATKKNVTGLSKKNRTRRCCPFSDEEDTLARVPPAPDPARDQCQDSIETTPPLPPDSHVEYSRTTFLVWIHSGKRGK